MDTFERNTAAQLRAELDEQAVVDPDVAKLESLFQRLLLLRAGGPLWDGTIAEPGAIGSDEFLHNLGTTIMLAEQNQRAEQRARVESPPVDGLGKLTGGIKDAVAAVQM